MAFNDALFQLGMDLTRSSPAQEEESAVVARDERVDCGNDVSATVSLKTVAIDLVGAGEIGTVRAVQRAVGRALAFSRLSVTASDLKRQPKTGAVTGTVSFTGGRIVDRFERRELPGGPEWRIAHRTRRDRRPDGPCGRSGPGFHQDGKPLHLRWRARLQPWPGAIGTDRHVTQPHSRVTPPPGAP